MSRVVGQELLRRTGIMEGIRSFETARKSLIYLRGYLCGGSKNPLEGHLRKD